jgi:hypothetical protein
LVRVNDGLGEECNASAAATSKCRTHEAPEVLIWGDSYAMHLVDGFLASTPSPKVVQVTGSVCGPFFDVAPIVMPRWGSRWAEQCMAANDRVHALLKTSPSIKYVVLSSPFGQYVGDKARLLRRDGTLVESREEAYAYFERTLQAIVDLGKVPVVFSPTPKSGYDTGRCLLKADFFHASSSDCDFAWDAAKTDQQSVYAFLSWVSQKHQVVWLEDGICSHGRCKASDDGVAIYRDGGHLTHEGSALLGRRMSFYARLSTPQPAHN